MRLKLIKQNESSINGSLNKQITMEVTLSNEWMVHMKFIFLVYRMDV